jgi:hypothetical protein
LRNTSLWSRRLDDVLKESVAWPSQGVGVQAVSVGDVEVELERGEAISSTTSRARAAYISEVKATPVSPKEDRPRTGWLTAKEVATAPTSSGSHLGRRAIVAESRASPAW